MKLKIDRSLLPIKAHFFFFFAGLGPLLPQLNVFGRQLGVSPAAMGMVTAVLPLLWAAAKPLFGYLVDYWPAHRKLVFMMLISVMTGSYCCLWFLPMPESPEVEPAIVKSVYDLSDTIRLAEFDNKTSLDLVPYTCHWNCSTKRFRIHLSNSTLVNTLYVDKLYGVGESCYAYNMDEVETSLFPREFVLPKDSIDPEDSIDEIFTIFSTKPIPDFPEEIKCNPKRNCSLLCYEDDLDDLDDTSTRTRRDISNGTKLNDLKSSSTKEKSSTWTRSHSELTKVEHSHNKTDAAASMSEESSFYSTSTFWAFVVLMCVGTVAFNVANCIGDAVCFDVLGPERASKYGAQRAWGTAGYGITALLGGWLVDAVSNGGNKDFTPAFVVALVATAADLYSCRALALPSLSSPADSGAALREVLKMPRVLVFIAFAVVAGTFDSFIIYYMFWFLEELAEETGSMAKIKLIEGVVVAAQSFVGELLFFYFSGKIIKRFGHGTTMTVALFCYGVRMALISLIRHPWHLVFIESIMQGPTYALCYSTIVGYAALVAPDGYSATVQGIVAGMDDGVGFAVGSLVGGQLYARAGGRGSFRILAAVAAAAALAHMLLYRMVLKRQDQKAKAAEAELPEEDEKMLPPQQDTGAAIYRDTVVPLNQSKDNIAKL